MIKIIIVLMTAHVKGVKLGQMQAYEHCYTDKMPYKQASLWSGIRPQKVANNWKKSKMYC